MPVYSYEAADPRGKKTRASVEAQDEAALISDLRKKGLVPLSVKAVEGRESISLKRVSNKDLLIFTHELGNLLESGLPIDKAIHVLSEYTENAPLREIARDIYADLQRGQALSQALSKHKEFPKLYVNMIRAGEVGGILENVIRRLASFLETSVAFREEVKSALIYPLLLTAVGGLAIVVLMLYVVPKFSAIFEDMGQALPLPTLVLLGISQFFISYWWGIALALGISFLLLNTYAKTAEGQLFMDGLKLKIPVIRGLHMKLLIARFSRTLGTLLQSGVPILEAIRVSREVVGNEVVSSKLLELENGVRRGKGVAGPLRESGVFPSIVGQMIATGEEAGRLEETFLSVADRFEGESRRQITRTVSLLEPVMILLMGLIVGFIVISMLIAVFSINEIPL
jgi:general secretion pathway protein F